MNNRINVTFINLGPARARIEFILDRVRLYCHSGFESAVNAAYERKLAGAESDADRRELFAEMNRIENNFQYWRQVGQKYRPGSIMPLDFGHLTLLPLGELNLEVIVWSMLDILPFEEADFLIF